jgi:hypothetical protein
MREVLYQDDGVRCSCDFLFGGEKVALHLAIDPGAWSVGKLKEYRSIFANKVLPGLTARGYHEVYATPYESDTKAQKLIKMFGLQEYGRSQGLVLMKREI